MKLKAVFDNNSYILINLFDNSTVARWFNYFKNFNNYECSTSGISSIGSNVTTEMEKQWNNIVSAVDKLKSIGFTPPRSLPATFDRNQETLNYWHRFFTYNVLWNWSEKNLYDPLFIPNKVNYEEWFAIVEKINVSVHELEKFTIPHENKKFVVEQYPLPELLFLPKRDGVNISTWFQFSEDDIKHNFNSYVDSTEQLVILNASILGKPVLQAFYENDDPTADDCTGRLGSFGGFIIDLADNRKNLYKSDQFQNWLCKYNLDPKDVPYEFPIGTVENASQDLNKFNPARFIKLEFIN